MTVRVDLEVLGNCDISDAEIVDDFKNCCIETIECRDCRIDEVEICGANSIHQ